MTIKEKLLRFNELVKRVEDLRRSMEKDGVWICAGYERGYPVQTSVQMVKPSMEIIASVLKQPVTILMKADGIRRTLDFGGVQYFECEWERKESYNEKQ